MKSLIVLTIPVLAALFTANFILIKTEPSWGLDEVAYIGEDALPDIASYTGIEIGGVRGQWGGFIRVDASDAAYADNGKCVFHYDLELYNRGGVPVDKFDYRLNSGSWSAVSGQPGIGAGGSVSAAGDIALAPGRQKVVIKLDSRESITESDEVNNVPFALRVDVDGECYSPGLNQPILADNVNE
jgi:hypothetical protein